MISREDAQANAGCLAAASVVVSKQVPMRDPLLAGLPPRFRPSGIGDLARLFKQDDDDPARRLARLSAAALVYSVNKKDRTQIDKLLRADELDELNRVHPLYNKPPKEVTDRSCPHCRILLSTLYGDKSRWDPFPPIAVLNHQARVEISFDPETNISQAKIDKFQVIVPKKVASKMITLSHPLRWADTAGGLFRRSDPVEEDGSQGEYFGNDRATIEYMWEKRARAKEAFIFEDVGWPVNEQLSADSENVIKIFDFEREGDHFLKYKYSLERCIRTNFGIAWEPSGLDIDGGEFTARAVPLDALNGAEIVTSSQYGEDEKARKLTRRDIFSLQAQLSESFFDTLAKGWSTPDDTVDDLESEFLNSARRFGQEWSGLAPFYLLEVSASKELHFTIPEVSPIDLWQNLTYTAPSILFTFLNRAVCQAPHLLLEELVTQNGVLTHAAGV